MRHIFISHAVEDKEIAVHLIRFLEDHAGVQPDHIFCSSVADYTIPYGTNFVEYIKSRLRTSDVIVTLLTTNFFKSEFCLSELGYAAVDPKSLFPIMCPPLEYSDLKGILLGTQVGNARDPGTFLALVEKVNDNPNLKNDEPLAKPVKALSDLIVAQNTAAHKSAVTKPAKAPTVPDSASSDPLIRRFQLNVAAAAQTLSATTGRWVARCILCDYYELPFVIRKYAHETQFQRAMEMGYLHLEAGPVVRRSHHMIAAIHAALALVDRDFHAFGEFWSESLGNVTYAPNRSEFWTTMYFHRS